MTRGIIISESEKREILGMYHLGTENHIEEQGVVGSAVRGLGRLFGTTADDAARAAAKAGSSTVDDAARAAAKGTNKYAKAAVAGFKGAPWARSLFTKLSRGQWGEVTRFLMGGSLRRGVFKSLRTQYGLGPALLAWGVGLLKQYIGILICISAIRTLLSAAESNGFTSLSQLNRYFNIPEYKDYGGTFKDLFYNFLDSAYLPNLKVLFRGLFWIPSILSNLGGTISYAGGIFDSIFDKGNDKTFIEALTDVDKYFGEKKDALDEKTSELPSDLLSSAPRDLVGKIKIGEDGVYLYSPEYEIQKIGSVFAVNIPNSGWYDLNDVEMLDVPTPKENVLPLNINSEEGDSESGGFASKITQRLGGFNPKYSIDVDKFSKTTRDPKFESKLQDAKNDASSNEESARVVDHLGVYNDPEKGMRLALAGRLKGGSENYYFDVVKQGSEWGWIDVEENNKWKPFEEY